MQSRDLAARFEAYSDWRRRLSARISDLHEWLSEQELADAQADLAIQQLLERLHQDKLVVAFVAEFSRGKSELINAVFFADFGQRLLPSAAGRTTMCPTELLYDSTRPPSIRLLPIETRSRDKGRTAGFGSIKGPSLGHGATGEERRLAVGSLREEWTLTTECQRPAGPRYSRASER